jgi:hypothetical protein
MNKPISSDEALDVELLQVMKHLMVGEIKKGKCIGIHYFCTAHHKIAQITKPVNEQGIWEASLATRHPKTNAWVYKNKTSTLFPNTWSESTLLLKLKEAYRKSKRVTPYKKKGTTQCGIEIVFIYQQNVITSCYPLYK